MRVPPVRFPVRGMMAVTAAVAVTLGGERLHARRVLFLELAEAHASRAYDYRVRDMCFRDECYEADGRRLREEWSRYLDEVVTWSTALERKYRDAASHPWRPVEPDPPPPPTP